MMEPPQASPVDCYPDQLGRDERRDQGASRWTAHASAHGRRSIRSG